MASSLYDRQTSHCHASTSQSNEGQSQRAHRPVARASRLKCGRDKLHRLSIQLALPVSSPRPAENDRLACQAAALSPGKLAQQCWNGGILEATVGATFKLFLVCGFVGWLLNSGRISEDTAPILSKIAFNMMLPCMLFTSLASTLANNFQWSMLAIPIIAIIQVAIGALGGKIAVWLVEGRRKKKPGWHPLNPAKSADRIAQSTAIASRLPLASEALLPDPDKSPRGTKELIQCCCAYGNSFTLPSVFMMSLLSAAGFQRATGYTALFLMAWSPMLWGYGYRILSSAAGPSSHDDQGPLHSFDESDMETAQLALKANPDRSFEPQEAALQSRLALRRWTASAKRRIEKSLNPPLVGILLGILIGVSPLGKPLFAAANASTAPAAGVPIELTFCLGVLKLGVETLGIFASGTLAVSTTVLAASLFRKIPETSQGPDDSQSKAQRGPQTVAGVNFGQSGKGGEKREIQALSTFSDVQVFRFQDPKDWKKGRSDTQLDTPLPSHRAKSSKSSMGQNLLRIIVPQSSLEWKMIVAISFVRFGFVPLGTLAVVSGFQHMSWLPTDPVVKLALLLQACMPSAQNLALLVNLQTSTQFLAPKLAKLLLQLYLLAVIPVTCWVSVFVSSLGLPLASL